MPKCAAFILLCLVGGMSMKGMAQGPGLPSRTTIRNISVTTNGSGVTIEVETMAPDCSREHGSRAPRSFGLRFSGMRSPPCRSTHPGKQGRVYSRTRFFVPKQSADGAGCGRPEGPEVAGNLEWQK